MERKGVGKQTLEILQAMYEKSSSFDETLVVRTDCFKNVMGLRQGSVVSPLLAIYNCDG